jgi:hypothetical protein
MNHNRLTEGLTATPGGTSATFIFTGCAPAYGVLAPRLRLALTRANQ